MDSDDDSYLSECLDQSVKKGQDGDPDLFARPDGLPMAFENLDFDYKISEMIEAHGGIVVDSYNEEFKENTIKICSRDSTYNTSQDVFDKLFVYDSITTNNLVKLSDYRLSKSVQCRDVEYDPEDILLGYKRWKEIKPFSGVEDEDEECQQESNIEMKESDQSFQNCEFEETGSLKTEDELWEAREPHQVYISQDPEEHLGDCEMMIDQALEEAMEQQHSNQEPDEPTFINSLIHGKFV